MNQIDTIIEEKKRFFYETFCSTIYPLVDFKDGVDSLDIWQFIESALIEACNAPIKYEHQSAELCNFFIVNARNHLTIEQQKRLAKEILPESTNNITPDIIQICDKKLEEYWEKLPDVNSDEYQTKFDSDISWNQGVFNFGYFRGVEDILFKVESNEDRRIRLLNLLSLQEESDPFDI